MKTFGIAYENSLNYYGIWFCFGSTALNIALLKDSKKIRKYYYNKESFNYCHVERNIIEFDWFFGLRKL